MTTPVEFMSISRFAPDSGRVRILHDVGIDIGGRDVVLVEDIVDTGLTLTALTETLRAHRPNSLEVCTLLDKPECRKTPFQPKYVGFKIPNEFVVGF